MLNKFKNLVSDEQGQGATEYGLVVALVVGVIIVAIAVFTGALSDLFGRIKDSLNNTLKAS